MPLYANMKSERELIPEAIHQSVCCSVYDIGTQHSEYYNKDIHQVVIMWELPECRMKIEQMGKEIEVPMVISNTYRLSLHPKERLRQTLDSWRGKTSTPEELAEGFDLEKLIGAPCQLQVLHKEKDGTVYANIGAVMALPKGAEKPKGERKQHFFSFDGNQDIDAMDGVPEWIVSKIKLSKEWLESHKEQSPDYTGPVKDDGAPDAPDWAAEPPPPAEDDDLPF